MALGCWTRALAFRLWHRGPHLMLPIHQRAVFHADALSNHVSLRELRRECPADRSILRFPFTFPCHYFAGIDIGPGLCHGVRWSRGVRDADAAFRCGRQYKSASRRDFTLITINLQR